MSETLLLILIWVAILAMITPAVIVLFKLKRELKKELKNVDNNKGEKTK